MKAIRVYASGKCEPFECMGELWANMLEHESGDLVRERFFLGVEPACEAIGSLDAPKVGVWVYVEQPREEYEARTTPAKP